MNEVREVLNTWTENDKVILKILIRQGKDEAISEMMEPHIWDLGLTNIDDEYFITEGDIEIFKDTAMRIINE